MDAPANTSLTPGYLTPTNVIPYDDDLLDLLQPIIVGIGGFWQTPNLVRPKYQLDDVPNMPDMSVDWLAFGIRDLRTSNFNYQGVGDDGQFTLEKSEDIGLLISSYGPHARSNLEQLRDGFSMGQNLTPLLALKMSLVGVGDPVPLPVLLASKWQRRFDVTVTLRRYVIRDYNVQTVIDLPSISDGPLGLDNELYVTPILAP